MSNVECRMSNVVSNVECRMSWSEEVLRPSQNGRQIFPWKISDSPWKTYVDGIPPDVLSE